MASLRLVIPQRVSIIPKIETQTGILCLKEICTNADADTIMFDKDDLYVSLRGDSDLFELLVNKTRSICHELNIKCLELKGVVFG